MTAKRCKKRCKFLRFTPGLFYIIYFGKSAIILYLVALNSSSAPVKSSCVYTFRVVLISECPIRCSNVLGFIPDKEYIITKLRENGDLKRIYRNIFISYITKNLDNYIKYFDEALQWVKKNNIKSDEMAQWIKENNIQ